MRRPAPLCLLFPLLLAACAGGDASPAEERVSALDIEEVKTRAPRVSELVRAAAVCGLPFSDLAKDRAARIEAAALDLAMREGSTPARDSFLRDVQPPHFDPRRRGRDRARYCGQKRPEVERMDGLLSGSEGASLSQRAEAIRNGP
jgi:hypothetical protein